jgi:hypothetical protein
MFTDVSEVIAASIIRTDGGIHGATFYKTVL